MSLRMKTTLKNAMIVYSCVYVSLSIVIKFSNNAASGHLNRPRVIHVQSPQLDQRLHRFLVYILAPGCGYQPLNDILVQLGASGLDKVSFRTTSTKITNQPRQRSLERGTRGKHG